MKKLIINGVIGVVLFGGSLVGGLAATGRLNHEGVANIPLLSSFFPAPPPGESGEAGGDGREAPATGDAAPMGEVANADHSGDPAVTDAAHGADGGGAQEPEGPRRTKVGKSAINPEEPAADDGHGGGEAAADGHGADDGHDPAPKKPKGAGAEGGHDPGAKAKHPAERDFNARELAMAQDKANKYAPGGYFRFAGMPSGVSPEQLNEAWQRVQGVLADLERKKTALDLREQELGELADDIGRRHLELGRLREGLNTAQRALDDRITKFGDQVKLVRNDEVEGLRRNAKTFESFEPSKAAELITEQWGTEQGQTEILKTFEFMTKGKVNDIIKELANPLIQDVLKKRLLVSKEAAATGKGRK